LSEEIKQNSNPNEEEMNELESHHFIIRAEPEISTAINVVRGFENKCLPKKGNPEFRIFVDENGKPEKDQEDKIIRKGLSKSYQIKIEQEEVKGSNPVKRLKSKSQIQLL
jgi:hypothetical protein